MRGHATENGLSLTNPKNYAVYIDNKAITEMLTGVIASVSVDDDDCDDIYFVCYQRPLEHHRILLRLE